MDVLYDNAVLKHAKGLQQLVRATPLGAAKHLLVVAPRNSMLACVALGYRWGARGATSQGMCDAACDAVCVRACVRAV
jgi:hypothetical protein